MTAPTPWLRVTDYVLAYHDKMNNVSNLLVAESPTIRMAKDHEHLNFIVDSEALKRINDFTKLPKFDHIEIFFGTDEGKRTNTIIVMGVDADGNALAEHKNNSTPAEETWPEEGYRLRTSRDDLEDFFKV